MPIGVVIRTVSTPLWDPLLQTNGCALAALLWVAPL